MDEFEDTKRELVSRQQGFLDREFIRAWIHHLSNDGSSSIRTVDQRIQQFYEKGF